MNSIILEVAARVLLPVMILLSVVFLLRGHNEPGGGFIGGLVAATGFILYALAAGLPAARRELHIQPRTLIAAGLFVAILSGIPGLLGGGPYLTGKWIELDIAGFDHVKIGTPFFFDLGVYLVVVGVTLLMAFTLEERAR